MNASNDLERRLDQLGRELAGRPSLAEDVMAEIAEDAVRAAAATLAAGRGGAGAGRQPVDRGRRLALSVAVTVRPGDRRLGASENNPRHRLDVATGSQMAA